MTSASPLLEVTAADIEGEPCQHKNAAGDATWKTVGYAFGKNKPDEEYVRCVQCGEQKKVERR